MAFHAYVGCTLLGIIFFLRSLRVHSKCSARGCSWFGCLCVANALAERSRSQTTRACMCASIQSCLHDLSNILAVRFSGTESEKMKSSKR